MCGPPSDKDTKHVDTYGTYCPCSFKSALRVYNSITVHGLTIQHKRLSVEKSKLVSAIDYACRLKRMNCSISKSSVQMVSLYVIHAISVFVHV